MQKIIVHCEEALVKVAVMEDSHLAEYHLEQSVKKQLAGNIYKGRVVNVLPGMQAAFVQIGLDKNAFLYIDDVLPAHLQQIPKIKPCITQVLRPGQELLLQVVKEPLGGKGARVTTHIALPGRWLVYMPDADYVGVSRKIQSEAERDRLKALGEQMRTPGEGLIIRTVAQGESGEALEHDLLSLREQWNGIAIQADRQQGAGEIHSELDIIERLIRDILTDNVQEIVIDNAEKAKAVAQFVNTLSPELTERVKTYRDPQPLWQCYGIDEQLEKALRKKIWLKSGGYIIIDRTEALTAVDVNTGKYIGSFNLEQTVYTTNLEAAEEIARLLRLRDIGGIIIVDFIDMTLDKHRAAIVEKLSEAMKKDRTKSLVVGWTRLGLLEITRKKVRQNLDDQFFDLCAHCGGNGKVFSPMHPLYKP